MKDIPVRPGECWWAEPPVPWTDPAMVALIQWFTEARAGGRLPKEPFAFSVGVEVVNTAGFYEALHHDVLAGSNGPRAKTGALKADFERLKGLMEGPV